MSFQQNFTIDYPRMTQKAMMEKYGLTSTKFRTLETKLIPAEQQRSFILRENLQRRQKEQQEKRQRAA